MLFIYFPIGDGDLGVRDCHFKKSNLLVIRIALSEGTAVGSLRGHCPVQGRGGPIWTEIDATMVDANKENLSYLHSANIVKHLLWASPGGKISKIWQRKGNSWYTTD